ncbi:RDD family protein [Pedobacter sp. P26]|uniref:RDD family protein n=1 Tax=Pedobacter sp. P26 TaxID=3423956 RepID=UPI003D670B6B
MDSIRISTAQNIDIDYEIAGLGERIAARCIDLAGFVVIAVITLVVMGAVSVGISGSAGMIVLFVFIAIFAFYDLVCEITMDGQTLGKKGFKNKSNQYRWHPANFQSIYF